MTNAREWHKETLAKMAAQALVKNNFRAEYVATKEEARQKLLSLIPPKGSVGIGGSYTVIDLDIINELAQRGNEVLNHGASGLSPEERKEIRRKQLTADCFICSTNAVTMDGRLVNMDGTGNRVAAMIFGPQMVIVVAGVNKIVPDIDAAITRIETVAAPINSKRLKRGNPCEERGTCTDCKSEKRICNILTVLHKKPNDTDFIVLLVGEELGF